MGILWLLLLFGDYNASLERWRLERAGELQRDNGWLTVAGLFWLKEGPNRFGADASNDIVLPPGSAPARAGVFDFRAGRTTLRVEPRVTVILNGSPVREAVLEPGSSELATMGALSFQVIERGGRYAIRLRDNNSALRRNFRGLRWFAPDAAFRVTARFVRYAAPQNMTIVNVLGQTEQQPSPGYAVFSLGGREYRLYPTAPSPGELFFVFRDRTSGKLTYAGGRFLDAEMPAGGRLVLDFNKAYNPPCAFNPYTTCPLPPRQNQLPLAICAGEQSPPG